MGITTNIMQKEVGILKNEKSKKQKWSILKYVNKYAENGYTKRLAWNLQKLHVVDEMHFDMFYTFYKLPYLRVGG